MVGNGRGSAWEGLGGALALLALFLLCFAHTGQAQLQAADDARPTHVQGLPQGDSSREDALLCYHSGAAYFIKLPHPVYGMQNYIYQRVTTGAPGHMTGFELRLYNDYPGHTRHAGALQLSVHRRVSGLPGAPEQLVELDADTLGNEIIAVPLPIPFHFMEGEEFYLGLGFQPAAAMDTVAYVTGPLGSYSGHSFYLEDGQVTWWGNGQSTLFGDFHFCADVWLDSAQPFLHFPWTSLDLGKGLAGRELELTLPLVNQGTAPLVLQSVTMDEAGWNCHVEGPDSLAPADTLLLHLSWLADSAEAISEAELTLRSNAANGPVRRLPVRAVSSAADVLMADWDEWELATLQEGEVAEAGGWRQWTGLGRPGPFMGHDAGWEALHLENILALRNLTVAQGSPLRLRWAQYQRMRQDMVWHALVWRCNAESPWMAVPGVDLHSQELLGPENLWWQLPWISFPAPCSGNLELGLLYGGLGAGDQWYVDDLELVVDGTPGAPKLEIASRCGAMVLSWHAVPGADAYSLRQVGSGGDRLLAWTTATSWTHWRAQRLQQGCYQVRAWKDDGRGLPALPELEDDFPQEDSGP
jgi:hypothetical protein